MTNGSVNSMRVAILLGDNFEQVEMTEPRTALEAAGAHTTLVSPVHGEIHGVRHDQEVQDSFEVDLPLAQANPEDFDIPAFNREMLALFAENNSRRTEPRAA
jgi:deglycase